MQTILEIRLRLLLGSVGAGCGALVLLGSGRLVVAGGLAGSSILAELLRLGVLAGGEIVAEDVHEITDVLFLLAVGLEGPPLENQAQLDLLHLVEIIYGVAVAREVHREGR